MIIGISFGAGKLLGRLGVGVRGLRGGLHRFAKNPGGEADFIKNLKGGFILPIIHVKKLYIQNVHLTRDR